MLTWVQYEAAIIQGADYFVVTEFLGYKPGSRPYRQRARCASRREALAVKATIKTAEPTARLLAYAIKGERQAYVG